LTKYADIVVPVPLWKLFTYGIPEETGLKLCQAESIAYEINIQIGSRVLVPFGKSNKLTTGIVWSIHNNKPEDYETKPIAQTLDNDPILFPQQLDLWKWISEYYFCPIGDVYRAALPAGLRLESESCFYLNPDFEPENQLSQNETIILDYISNKTSASILEINKIIGLKSAHRFVKQLLEINAIFVEEKVTQKYKTKKEKVLYLGTDFRSEEALSKVFDKLQKAPKQLELLMTFIQKSGSLKDALNGKRISRNKLFSKKDNLVGSQLDLLIKKNILQQETRIIDRLDFSDIATIPISTLSDEQTNALNEIKLGFEEKKPVLLHGVTSSGKTEIYITLIEEALNKNFQVLYILPEIALTTQITRRLKLRFGNKLGVYHSKYSDNERVEIWNDLLKNKNYRVIVGVRSAIFLPFSNLGLIIIDEEHENSFKQYDPSPRYHARDVALVLGKYFNANVLLGSATPSIESYYNTKIGKYILVELNSRYKGICLPEILLVDIKDAKKRKIMVSHFSPPLLELITKALEKKEQIILFQNRRGFAPYLECKGCGWVPKCKHCDVSLTYHKNINNLICHYCGYSVDVYFVCKACEMPALNAMGFGTQKIEEEIQKIFPETKVARLDLDTTRSKNSYDKILSDFEHGKVDILIGTQMVSKGLDFDRVSLVGILNADSLLNYPDFRAYEKSFQMLTQVSGRAGRKYSQGKVVIQTSNPKHQIFNYVYENNYTNFFKEQIEERQKHKYPPFHRLVFIVLKHKNFNTVIEASKILTNLLRSIFGNRIIGPFEPHINRISDYYLQQIILKLEKTASHQNAKIQLHNSINRLLSDEKFRYVFVSVDVDPY